MNESRDTVEFAEKGFLNVGEALCTGILLHARVLLEKQRGEEEIWNRILQKNKGKLVRKKSVKRQPIPETGFRWDELDNPNEDE